MLSTESQHAIDDYWGRARWIGDNFMGVDPSGKICPMERRLPI
jgi:hypothetical protein